MISVTSSPLGCAVGSMSRVLFIQSTMGPIRRWKSSYSFAVSGANSMRTAPAHSADALSETATLSSGASLL